MTTRVLVVTDFFTRSDRALRRTIHVVPEHGSAAIATLAAQISADLIVVGTRGRNGARKLFLGSVAEKIIGESECDTLVVPPSERSN